MKYTNADHPYDCDPPSDEIRRLLVELDYPHRNKKVLRYFHEELKYSTRELAELFGVARQTLQQIVHDFEDFNFDPQVGRMTKMDAEQREIGDYGGVGLADFVE